MSHRPSISIIGAGIAGLSVARALALTGCGVMLHERAPALRAAGGGLLLWSNAMRGLGALGLADVVIAAGAIIEQTEFRTEEGRLLSVLPVGDFGRRFGAPSILVSRATLMDILARAVRPDCLRLGEACTGFTASADRVEAHFEGGHSIAADALIGADGLGSVIRTALFGDRPPRSAGQVAWVGIANASPRRLTPGLTIATVGRGLRFWSGSIGQGRVYWYATVREDAKVQTRSQLERAFQRFHEPIPELIAATEDAALVRSAVRDRPPARAWNRGRVTLLGDAAHPATPDLGQGACQAIESAVTLADCIRHHATPEGAFDAYQRRRLDRTARITNLSWLTAVQSMLPDPLSRAIRDMAIKRFLPRIAGAELDWILGDFDAPSLQSDERGPNDPEHAKHAPASWKGPSASA